MKFLYFATLWSLVPGMLIRLSFGGAGILLADVFLLIFLAVFLFRVLFLSEKLVFPSWKKNFLLFFCIAFFTFLWGIKTLPGLQILSSGAYLVRMLGFFAFACATQKYLDTPNFQQKVWSHLLWIYVITLVLGFIQFLFIPDISQFSTEGGLDPHIGRMLGTWLDPNYFAGFVGFMGLLLLGKIYQKSTPKKWILKLLFLLGVLAIFLTFSRSGYLALVIGLGGFFVFRDIKILFLVILITIAGIFTSDYAQKRVGQMLETASAIIFNGTSGIDDTASLRLQNWKKSFTLFQKYPISGIGYNTYRYRAAEEGIVDPTFYSAGGADSTPLTILVTTGIFGFLAYLYLLFGFIKKNIQTLFSFRKNTFLLAFLGGFLVLFVQSLFVNSFFFPLLILPFLAMEGAGSIEKING